MIREYNSKFKAAYHFAYQIYIQQNDVKNAEKMMVLLMETDQMDDQAFSQLVSIYKAQGLDERGAYKKVYKKYVKALEKAGKKEKAKVYQDALKKMQ
jgi:lipopolysaccharide biosynthesis regulator YciM